MHTLRTITFSVAVLAAFGCGKDTEPKAEQVPATKPAEPPAPKPAPAPPKPADDDQADYIRVLASHAEQKPGDPVTVTFDSFRITKAELDPGNLEGATAELEIDLGSLSSGVDKRDGHLKSADYLDVGAHPKAVVKISDVAKKADGVYTANAEVTAHGVTKSMPVEFRVVHADDDSVKVKASHTFEREAFSIGKPEGDSVAPELTIEMQLTFENS